MIRNALAVVGLVVVVKHAYNHCQRYLKYKAIAEQSEQSR